MKKPAELAYGLDERPPVSVIAATALQQAAIVLIWVFPTIVLARVIGATPQDAATLFSLAFIACGLGTLIQAVADRRIGSGFLAPVSPSSAHLAPTLLAAQAGGLPMVAGMTILAGAATVILARVLGRVRALMPPEIAGAVVCIIGIAVSLTGARMLATGDGGEGPATAALAVGALTLMLAVGLGVWGRGVLRWACMLIAMAGGTLAAVPLGLLHWPEGLDIGALPLFAMPRVPMQGFAFDLALLPVFLVAAVASTLKTAGLVTTLQRTNDAGWVRPDQRSIAGGVTGDGLATMLAGLLGTPAVNMSPTNVALQMASGVTSRVIAFATAGLCIALACFPRLAALLAQVPTPVIAATLLYAGGLMLASGMQLACARLLDARRSLSVGLAIAAALVVEAVPHFAAAAPQGLRPLLNAIAFGTLVALVLNAVLRIGMRREVTLHIPEPATAGEAVEDFVTRAGASWGARRDVIARAAYLAASALDAVTAAGVARGDIALTLGFDETRIDLRLAWVGPPLMLADRPPSAAAMLDEDDAPARMAGYMVRRLSDRLRQRSKDGTTEVTLHLDH
jgi:NCS2 family nucleobase:cation symporter-2